MLHLQNIDESTQNDAMQRSPLYVEISCHQVRETITIR